jgi:mannose-6-phosphate isomerase-like protein (cupin superfamily)
MDIRPWGTYEVLTEDSGYKVKRIIVKPGQRLSYQTHEKRSEYWVIVQGHANATIDGKETPLDKGDAIIIDKREPHRITNMGEVDVVFIEVQMGEYLGEDDIIRLEDDYGRE